MDAMDIVRDWTLLWLETRFLTGSAAAPGPADGPPFIVLWSTDRSAAPPESPLFLFGITRPLIVCDQSLSLVYDDMDIVLSSEGLSGTTRPCAVVLARLLPLLFM